MGIQESCELIDNSHQDRREAFKSQSVADEIESRTNASRLFIPVENFDTGRFSTRKFPLNPQFARASTSTDLSIACPFNSDHTWRFSSADRSLKSAFSSGARYSEFNLK